MKCATEVGKRSLLSSFLKRDLVVHHAFVGRRGTELDEGPRGGRKRKNDAMGERARRSVRRTTW